MMNRTAAVLASLALALLAMPAGAYSPIGNVNGWGRDQLAKAGIVVAPWRHAFEREDPPMRWVRVTFDCATVPDDQPVVMTAWLRTADFMATTSAARAERGADGKATLTFCVAPAQVEASSVVIAIWSRTEDGHASRGYELSMRRVLELAADPPATAPATPAR